MKFSDLLKVKLATHLFHPLFNFHRPYGLWRAWGAVRSWRKSNDGRRVTVFSGHGKIDIEALAAGMLKVIISFSGTRGPTTEDNGYFTYAVTASTGPALFVREDEERLAVGGEQGVPMLLIDKATGRLRAEQDGRVLFNRAEAVFTPHGWVSCALRTGRPVRWLGLGQKTGGLFRNGRFVRLWNTDHSDIGKRSDPLYQTCPFALALEDDGRAWGVFFDQPRYGDLKLSAAGRPGRIRCRSRRGPIALYLLPGPALGDAVRRFSVLTGRYRLPPLWALGHHHSRWEPDESAERLSKIARGFRDRGIPLDALHIDIGHMRGYRCFTWDPGRFPDPDRLIGELKAQDIEPVVIADPGLKKDEAWEIYQEGDARGHFLKDASGKTFIAPVWPGPAGFPDFANAATAAWWGGLYREYTRRGIAGYWIDMNEPAAFTPRRTLPGGLVHHATETDAPGNGGAVRGERVRDHDELHNYYGFLMARATAAGLERLRPGQRSFLFTRSSYAGIQRFASSWTGDNKSNWDHLRLALPMIMNMGLCGQLLTGPDLGGFWGAPGRELFIRFIQAGTLFPFHRNHTASDTPPQEIWEFGPEAEAICAAHIRLRYALLPALYTALRRGTVTGDPVCRPLCYDFPGDPGCLRPEIADTHHLCGSHLLTAPVLFPGLRERRVYFPNGSNWLSWWTHAPYRGGTEVMVPAPLDRLPLFVKAGSVLPTIVARPEGFVSTSSLSAQTLSLDIYPAAELSGELYLDDGTSRGYERGEYALYSLSGATDDRRLTLSIKLTEGRPGSAQFTFANIQVRIAGEGAAPAPAAITVNTVTLGPGRVTGDGLWTTISLDRESLDPDITIEIEY